MLSQTMEYSLRAAVYLASQAPLSRTTRQIARATNVPSAYLSKLLQALSRAGIVRSSRGAKGGMALARGAGEITILEVVQAVDPIERIESCPLKLAAHGVRLCPLHRRLDSALELVESAFRQTTLAELLAEPTTSIPLCRFPNVAEPRKERALKR
jgi:Rrf2 family protein